MIIELLLTKRHLQKSRIIAIRGKWTILIILGILLLDFKIIHLIRKMLWFKSPKMPK